MWNGGGAECILAASTLYIYVHSVFPRVLAIIRGAAIFYVAAVATLMLPSARMVRRDVPYTSKLDKVGSWTWIECMSTTGGYGAASVTSLVARRALATGSVAVA